MNDPRDIALQRSCPVIAAPRFGALPEAEHGQRIIVASNGVFVQVKRDWLDCVERIGSMDSALPLPYGKMTCSLRFSFGPIPLTLLEEFIAAGRAALPNEIAGGLIYSRERRQLRLAVYEPLTASPTGVNYRMPALLDDETVAVDLHTHGLLAAVWSPTDDLDDRSVKVCGVFGTLDRDPPSAAFRLAINGLFKRLPHPWEVEPSDALEPEQLCRILNLVQFDARFTDGSLH